MTTRAIDIQGVRVQNDESGSNLNSNAGLFTISRPTGGEVFQNSNDLKNNFGRMLHAQEVVYVLAFQGPSGNSGKYHDLKVKLVNVQGGARASNRAGYYEGGGETPQERTLSNAEVIVNDIPQNDVHVHALSAAFPMGGNNLQVPVILELDGNDLTKDVRGGSTRVEFYVYAFDSEGVVRDRQLLTLDLKQVLIKTGELHSKVRASLAPATSRK